MEILFKANIRIAERTLAAFYLQHKIKPRASQMVYRNGLANKYEVARKPFALRLGNIISTGKPIIYVDESTFHSWMYQQRSWSLPDAPNNHQINTKRFVVTVYGAIGTCLKKPVYHFGPSTNKDDFRTFIREVKRNLISPELKPFMLFDGATAHTARVSQALLKQLFEPLKNVPHSCGFNCK